MAVSRPNTMSMFNDIAQKYDKNKNAPKESVKESNKKEKEPIAELIKEAVVEPVKGPETITKEEPVKDKPAKISPAITVPEPAEKKEPVMPTASEAPAKAPRKAKKTKNVPATYYMSPEIIEAVKIGARAYGGNQSLYIRSLITKDFKENEAMYRSLPDIDDIL